jgi:cardiolipin synthase
MSAETLTAQPATVNDLTASSYIQDPRTQVPGNAVRLLRNGSQAFPAWLAAIEAARTRVSLEMYIFSDDSIGRRFADALARAAHRGVVVRLLTDYVGCRYTPAEFFQQLRARGVWTRVYHGYSGWRPNLWRLFRRNHRKTLVVDGEVAFTGGLNISSEWLPESEGGEDWRDAAVAVRGPAVSVMEGAFARTWNRRAKKGFRLDTRLWEAAEPVGAVPVAVLINNERGERYTIRRATMHAIRASRRRVMLANPYFVPDGGVLRALRTAAARGVDVRILVPSESDSALVDAAARATFTTLLAAGARIWQSRRVVHTKVVLIDDSFVSIGSYNFDNRSLAYNLEMVANIVDPVFAGETAAMLDAELVEATELDLATFQARPWHLRLFERSVHALRQWL